MSIPNQIYIFLLNQGNAFIWNIHPENTRFFQLWFSLKLHGSIFFTIVVFSSIRPLCFLFTVTQSWSPYKVLSLVTTIIFNSSTCYDCFYQSFENMIAYIQGPTLWYCCHRWFYTQEDVIWLVCSAAKSGRIRKCGFKAR